MMDSVSKLYAVGQMKGERALMSSGLKGLAKAAAEKLPLIPIAALSA